MSAVHTSDKELRQWIKLALAQGWRIDRGSRHLRWYSPDGVSIVVTSCTPGDHRAMKNTRSDLKRAGLKF